MMLKQRFYASCTGFDQVWTALTFLTELDSNPCQVRILVVHAVSLPLPWLAATFYAAW